jgi:hypothetical protein
MSVSSVSWRTSDSDFQPRVPTCVVINNIKYLFLPPLLQFLQSGLLTFAICKEQKYVYSVISSLQTHIRFHEDSGMFGAQKTCRQSTLYAKPHHFEFTA